MCHLYRYLPGRRGEHEAVGKNRIMTLDVTIIGAGMIVHDLILPAVYALQRAGSIGKITVCATRSASLAALKKNAEIQEAFPGQDFSAFPDPEAADSPDPELYKEILSRQKPYQAVIVALPDQLHFPVVMDALGFNQHVACVKPLVLEYRQSEEIRRLARERGLFVGVEYHKRFDRRSLIARRRYRRGELGEFMMGEAKMIEPYYYRSSNFQSWFTVDQTDPFVYVGCHYVDLVGFITGLKPVEVSVAGIERAFPNGRKGYMWANGRVRFENGALLSVTDGLGYPDQGAGSNEQCLTMFFEGENASGVLKHNDQFRGVEYGYLKPQGPAGKYFHYVNPDFFQYVPWEGPGYQPIGYGVDSVAALLEAIRGIELQACRAEKEPGELRRDACREVDDRGIVATPANSWVNALVYEAARKSIRFDGDRVAIRYQPEPRVEDDRTLNP
jgi:predicted dehydrogenase